MKIVSSVIKRIVAEEGEGHLDVKKLVPTADTLF